VLIVATVFVLANLLVDLLYGFLDPRTRQNLDGYGRR
jgi:ABC-type dipeptide/oligopeptide/nickel transport system permease component